MIVADLEMYLSQSSWAVATITGNDGQHYLVIEGLKITSGALEGSSCDVAVLKSNAMPWVPQAAIHTRPLSSSDG